MLKKLYLFPSLSMKWALTCACSLKKAHSTSEGMAGTSIAILVVSTRTAIPVGYPSASASLIIRSRSRQDACRLFVMDPMFDSSEAIEEQDIRDQHTYSADTLWRRRLWWFPPMGLGLDPQPRGRLFTDQMWGVHPQGWVSCCCATVMI